MHQIGYVMDGGFSNDSPCLDSYTITVSALHRYASSVYIHFLVPAYCMCVFLNVLA